MINNAKDAQIIVSAKDIDEVTSLPHVGIALHGMMQLMEFWKICKKNVDGYTQEIESITKTHAVRQPFSDEQIELLPEGERSWKWEMLHALPDLALNTDDRVSYLGRSYTVKSKKNYSEYGYIEYHLIEDYNSLNRAPSYE